MRAAVLWITLMGVSQGQIITTIAGGVYGPNTYCCDGGPATSAAINPKAVTVDSAGNVYIADWGNNRVRKVDTAGIITTIAGNGVSGLSTGDSGPAVDASFTRPSDICVDSAGNIYFSEGIASGRVRKVDPAGIITTVAGGGSGFADGLPATSASLLPRSIAIHPDGSLYLVDGYTNTIRKVGSSGLISTVAGNGQSDFSGDGGPAANAGFNFRNAAPAPMAFDGNGNLYVVDAALIGGSFAAPIRVRKIDAQGIVTTVAGTGSQGSGGDEGPATAAAFQAISGIAIDPSGNLYVADTIDHRIRRVSPDGVIHAYAGTRNPNGNGLGDGGPALNANLTTLAGLAADSQGNLFLVDERRIRKVTSGPSISVPPYSLDALISTVAGNGFFGISGDGGPATAAMLNLPNGVAVDSQGNLYVADSNNLRVRRVNAAGMIDTVAGSGLRGSTGDGAAATAASLNFMLNIALDNAGNIFIPDQIQGTIRQVDSSGTIKTIAGGGVSPADGIPAAKARLEIFRVARDRTGNLFIAGSTKIRKIDVSGIVTTVAGNGVVGFSGDGGPATNAQLNFPSGMAFDAAGNLFFTDSGSHRVRRISPDGTITTVAGIGVAGFSGDGGPAVNAMLSLQVGGGLAVDSAGNLFIADVLNNRVRMVDANGMIITVAGDGPGVDGGPAATASLIGPTDVALDPAGNLYIAESALSRIRKVTRPAPPGSLK